jgi:hypothetical protein
VRFPTIFSVSDSRFLFLSLPTTRRTTVEVFDPSPLVLVMYPRSGPNRKHRFSSIVCFRNRCRGNQLSRVVYGTLPGNGRFIIALLLRVSGHATLLSLKLFHLSMQCRNNFINTCFYVNSDLCTSVSRKTLSRPCIPPVTVSLSLITWRTLRNSPFFIVNVIPAP